MAATRSNAPADVRVSDDTPVSSLDHRCESTPGRHWIRVMIFTAEPAAILCLGRSSSLPAFGGGTRRQPQERQPICRPLNRPDPFESASLHTPRAAAAARPAKAIRLQLFPSPWTRPAFLCASTHPGGEQASPAARPSEHKDARIHRPNPDSARIGPQPAEPAFSAPAPRQIRRRSRSKRVFRGSGVETLPFTGGKPRPPQQA